jgi:diguanylate cyclase (GGDEF)-like protein
MKIRKAASPIIVLSLLCLVLISVTVYHILTSKSQIDKLYGSLCYMDAAIRYWQDASSHEGTQDMISRGDSLLARMRPFSADTLAQQQLQSLETCWQDFLHLNATTETRQQLITQCRESTEALYQQLIMRLNNAVTRLHLTWIPLAFIAILLLLILYYAQHYIHDKLAFQASHDPLTKLLNRNVYDELVETEIARSERYKYTMSLILFDIDHFKRVNDTYGHDVGDSVLIELSQLVNKVILKSDSLCRTGGEEFAIIAPETTAEQAHFVAEKLRSAIVSNRFTTVNSITVSFGLAEYIDREGSMKLFRRADQALYKAKRNGRNRVEIAH